MAAETSAWPPSVRAQYLSPTRSGHGIGNCIEAVTVVRWKGAFDEDWAARILRWQSEANSVCDGLVMSSRSVDSLTNVRFGERYISTWNDEDGRIAVISRSAVS